MGDFGSRLTFLGSLGGGGKVSRCVLGVLGGGGKVSRLVAGVLGGGGKVSRLGIVDLGGGGEVSWSVVEVECKDVVVGNDIMDGSSEMEVCRPRLEVVFAVPGRSSRTVDCLFRISSSSSSAISIKRLLRKELVDELVDPEAVCREQAAESFVSPNSLAVVIGKIVS